jgi:spore coat protein U-like protein
MKEGKKNMKQFQLKKWMAVAAALGTVSLAGTSMAGSATQNFDVNISLTTVCTLGSVTALDFAYTSLQGGAATATGGNFSVTCTNGHAYTFGLVEGGGGAAPGTPGLTGITPAADAVLGLTYTLTTSAAGATGNGVAQAFTVNGSMAGGQSGTCAGAVCSNAASGNKTHTLVLNF